MRHDNSLVKKIESLTYEEKKFVTNRVEPSNIANA
jgi:hypothetical protein